MKAIRHLLGAAFFVTCFHSTGFSALSVVGTPTASSSTAVQTLTWSYTTTTDTDTVLVVTTHSGDTNIGERIIDAVTYNGVSVGTGSVATADDANWTHAEVWLATNTAAGAHNVAVTYSGGANTDQAAAGAVQFAGADSSDPYGAVGTNFETSATPSVTVGSDSGEIVIAILSTDDEAGIAVSGSGVERWEFENMATDTSANTQTLTGGSPSVSPAWSQTSQLCAMAGVSIRPSSEGTFDQEGFSFGDDDGNEAAHTLDTQDTNITEEVGVKTLRTLINLTGTGSSVTPSLRFQKNGSGGYTLVPTVGSVAGVTGTIVVGDATNSGNNTASTQWSVSVPAAATGDLILVNIGWDDSTTTTDVVLSSGPNGETPNEINDTGVASGATAVRAKCYWLKATGTWAGGVIIGTPTASEQWTATVIKVPAGEFDATTPIGVIGSSVSAGIGNPWTAAITAGASDGDGRVVDWVVGDTDDPDGSIAGWTEIASIDRGAVGANFMVRESTVTNSESIAAQSGLTLPTPTNWVTVGYIVRPPADVVNEVYVSASANVTAGGEATTARLAAPSGKTTSDFDTGRRWDNENGSDAITFTDDNYSEFEWVLTTQSPATTNDYFEFETYINGAVADSYSVTPKWTIGTAAAGGPPPFRRRIMVTQ